MTFDTATQQIPRISNPGPSQCLKRPPSGQRPGTLLVIYLGNQAFCQVSRQQSGADLPFHDKAQASVLHFRLLLQDHRDRNPTFTASCEIKISTSEYHATENRIQSHFARSQNAQVMEEHEGGYTALKPANVVDCITHCNPIRRILETSFIHSSHPHLLRRQDSGP